VGAGSHIQGAAGPLLQTVQGSIYPLTLHMLGLHLASGSSPRDESQVYPSFARLVSMLL